MRKHLHRLLIAEENPHIVNVLTQTLKEDFEITVAATGKDAVRQLIRGKQFDCVITELDLPFFDGLELIQLIRMSKLISHTPILVLSAALDSSTRIACLEAGADSYMAKPFNPLEVKVKLHSMFRRALVRTEVHEMPLIPVRFDKDRLGRQIRDYSN